MDHAVGHARTIHRYGGEMQQSGCTDLRGRYNEPYVRWSERRARYGQLEGEHVQFRLSASALHRQKFPPSLRGEQLQRPVKREELRVGRSPRLGSEPRIRQVEACWLPQRSGRHWCCRFPVCIHVVINNNNNNNNNNIGDTSIISVCEQDQAIKVLKKRTSWTFQSGCCETHVAERFENDLLESEESEQDARFP